MNVMGGEYGAELEDLALRRKYADMLRAQAMQPPQSAGMAGRTVAPIHWTQALAGALKGVSGDMESGNVSRERKTLGKRYESESQDRLQKALAMARGVPGTSESIMDETAAGGEGRMAQIQTPGTPGDLMGAATMLAGSPNPMQQQLGYGAMSQQFAPKTAPKTVDLGDRIGLMDNRGQVIGYLPKSASPDASMREQGAQARHLAPSGSAILQNQGAMQRHQTPSGSAILGESGAMARHGAPSASAALAAETSRRGQDMGVNPAIQGALAAGKAYGKEQGEIRAATDFDPVKAATSAKKILDAVHYDPVTETDDISKLIDQSTSGLVQNVLAQGYGAATGDATTGRQAIGKLMTESFRITMDLMGGKLGAGISNADRDFVLGQLGDVSNANTPAPERAAAWNRAMSRLTAIAKQTPQRRSTDGQGGLPSQDDIEAEIRRRQGG